MAKSDIIVSLIEYKYSFYLREMLIKKSFLLYKSNCKGTRNIAYSEDTPIAPEIFRAMFIDINYLRGSFMYHKTIYSTYEYLYVKTSVRFDDIDSYIYTCLNRLFYHDNNNYCLDAVRVMYAYTSILLNPLCTLLNTYYPRNEH